jgi:hypothetical protein
MGAYTDLAHMDKCNEVPMDYAHQPMPGKSSRLSDKKS